jgi:3-hydroxymyristoyl/3-hydroxydecanoyl-(acyl carrier protein) dehydratase
MPDETASTIELTHHVDAGLRAFDGHFPGRPVMPGAYLLAVVLHEIEQRTPLASRLGAVPQVQQVKFLAPVGPGRTLRIRLQAQPQGVAFTVHDGATLVARGQLAAASQAGPA